MTNFFVCRPYHAKKHCQKNDQVVWLAEGDNHRARGRNDWLRELVMHKVSYRIAQSCLTRIQVWPSRYPSLRSLSGDRSFRKKNIVYFDSSVTVFSTWGGGEVAELLRMVSTRKQTRKKSKIEKHSFEFSSSKVFLTVEKESKREKGLPSFKNFKPGPNAV